MLERPVMILFLLGVQIGNECAWRNRTPVLASMSSLGVV
jgi:hypothetical protein